MSCKLQLDVCHLVNANEGKMQMWCCLQVKLCDAIHT